MEPSAQPAPQSAPYGDQPQDPQSASADGPVSTDGRNRSASGPDRSSDGRGRGVTGEKIGPGRSRTGLVVLLSFLLELVVIVGYGNQYVTKHVRGHLAGDTLRSHLYLASQTFSWRFSPPKGDSGHAWLAQLMVPVTFLVLSALLIAVVVRGSVTFFRAFFGVWGVVLLSTVAACYVRGAIEAPAAQAANRVDSLLFFRGAGTPEVLAGLALGLVVAFIAAVLTVATRRPAPTALPPGLIAVPPPPDPDQPPPYFGETDPSDRSRPLYGDRSATDRPQPTAYHFESAAADDAGARHAADGPPEAPAAATNRLPVLDEDGAPRQDDVSRHDVGEGVMAGAGGAGGAAAVADPDDKTTQLPVVDPDRGGMAPRPTRDEPTESFARPTEPAAADRAAAEPTAPFASAAPEGSAPQGSAPERGVAESAAPESAVAEPVTSAHAVPEPPAPDVVDTGARPATATALGQSAPEPAATPDAVATPEPAAVPQAEPVPSEPAAASPEPAAEPAASPQPSRPETTRFAEPPSAARPARPDAEQTAQFPRPPDDDDLAADPDLHN